MSSTSITPTTSSERIQSLDVLRGFALLGILILNIQSFAMPGSAYLNPMSYGDMNGLNKWVWILSHTLADTKMMAIFSTLFGAGIILVTDRAKQKTGKSAGLHYRRSFWLLVFGLIHAHLIWSGDILVAYAICAMIVYLFRNKSAKTLIILGMVVISVHTILYVLFGTSISNWPEDALEGAMQGWAPSQEFISDEIATVTGSLSEQISHNSESATFMETMVFLSIFLWRAGGLMLIGMALYKTGVLTAQRSSAFYKKGLFWGWLIGFPIVIFGMIQNFKFDWSYEYSMFFGPQFNYWGSLGVSFGYICGIMLLSQTDKFQWIKSRLAAVGQMAFTNYIAQSVICIFIFWGIGFKLFGEVSRSIQILIVFAVWCVQILWSKPWLDRFRFGPLEWLWRSLSYGKFQPMKK